ncbi:hypothetical protein J6590_010055 [Homalodisca vitripennis]|nr:hypothetical protein J6590_010055 [Homalodisca vitripennis]
MFNNGQQRVSLRAARLEQYRAASLSNQHVKPVGVSSVKTTEVYTSPSRNCVLLQGRPFLFAGPPPIEIHEIELGHYISKSRPPEEEEASSEPASSVKVARGWHNLVEASKNL